MASTATTATAETPRTPPSCRGLFLAFLRLGITGFGGVLPLARRAIVERDRWLSPEEFSEVLALCQFLPGGNIVNVSVLVGRRFGGWRGSLAAIGGLLIGPSVLVIALWTLYEQFASDRLVHGAVLGLAAAASGLLIAMAIKLLRPLVGAPVGLAIAAVTIAAIWLGGLPLVGVLVVMTPVSILLTQKPAT